MQSNPTTPGPSSADARTGAVTALLCHFAFWFGVLFATPIFIAIHNREDLVVSLPALAAGFLLASLLATGIGWKLADRAGARVETRAARILLALALVLAVQSNLVHDLFDYGAFNGQPVDLRANGWVFWLEWGAWLAAIPLLSWILSRMTRVPAWLPAISMVSFLLLLLPALPKLAEEVRVVEDEQVDPSVFAFSRIANLVHLLPDGFQGDVVRQVLDEDAELAAQFRGFTLYNNHVGVHQGTAPSLYTMLTGQPFDLNQGFDYKKVIPEILDRTYQNRLADAGYQLDYVPVNGYICPKSANSCIVRTINDMRARGIFRYRSGESAYSVRLLVDLVLFRLTPMYLKEKIYNDGKWLFSDVTLDGSSPWPDPVVREWTENLHLVDDRPVYKWHHFIGTHVPAKWNAECELLSEPSRERSDYYDQARCVLRGIASLLRRLEKAGVYDQTAMIISGDHGHNVAPDDLQGDPLNADLKPAILATGRPALLIKRMHATEPLNYSELPTSVLDIAAAALDLAGLADERIPAFDPASLAGRQRVYQVYKASEFYGGEPIPYIEYTVGESARSGTDWMLTDIRINGEVPATYDPVNRANAEGMLLGASLSRTPGRNKSSWITGRQLAFLIDVPAGAQSLELELYLPKWIPRQSFEYRFNGGQARRGPQLQPGPERWQTVRLPIAPGDLLPGRNFISVVFDVLHPPPDGDSWKAAAEIRTIRVVAGETP